MKYLALFCLCFLLIVEFSAAGRRPGGRSGGKSKSKKKPLQLNYAACYVEPNPTIEGGQVRGVVAFRQKSNGGPTEYKVTLSGFDSSDNVLKHGFHVHGLGIIDGDCGNTGGHYNPKGVNHGAPTDRSRHVGDLGNILENGAGEVSKQAFDKVISLNSRDSIIGRAIVVHAGEDDLGLGGDEGSLKTGNAGARLACCTIAVSDGREWN